MNVLWSSAALDWHLTSSRGWCPLIPSSRTLTWDVYISYLNVRHATKAAGKPSVRPLLLLLPFAVPTAIQVAWLSQPEIHHSAIIKSALFVPFLCAWGLQFAHQVGRMILAHVTSSPFPYWDWMWMWSIIGAVDANLPHILDRLVTSPVTFGDRES